MINRRDFMKLTAIGGGAVFLSGLTKSATGADYASDDEFFSCNSQTPIGGLRGRLILTPAIL